MISTGSLLLLSGLQAILASIVVVGTGEYLSGGKPWPPWWSPPQRPFVAWLWWALWLWAGIMIVEVGCLAVIPRLFP